MPLDEDEHTPEAEEEVSDAMSLSGARKWWKLPLLFLLAVLLLVAGLGWLNREQVADNLIASQLDSLGIPARYKIKEIGTARQVLEQVVIGDPARPDLTIERVEVKTVMRFGLPRFGHVTLVKPRLFGSYREGKLSFGSLDSVIFSESEEPFVLPDLDLVIQDGRGLIESDFGPVGIKTEGSGRLQDGFAGTLAVTAPILANEECSASDVSLYGKLSISGERPRFAGPLRLGGLVCEQLGLDLARAGAELDVTADRQFDGGEGTMSLAAGPLRFGANAIRSAKGEARVTYRKDALVAHYQVGAEGLASPLAGLSALAIDGSARSTGGLGRFDLQADLDGEGLAMGRSFESSLASMARSGEGTLVQPVLDRIRASLSRESRGSRLSGSFILRQSPDGTSLVVPQAAMKGGSGKSLLSLSRLKIALASKDGPRVTGNFAIGGAGLPVISGRMEGAPGARLALNIRMPEYRAGTASLALPRLVMVQRPGGALGFSGEARLSGAIPGGRVDGLVVPLEGNWSGRSGIALWRKCVELRFDRLEMADLGLVSSSLPVCPSRSGAIVQSGAQGIRVIAGLPGMELVGSLGSSPIRITSGPAAVAWPGKITVRDVTVALGAPDYVSNFRIGKLDGQLGSVLTGRFEDSDVLLDAVPLDVLDAAGAWQFADGVLTLAEGSFRLEDREQVDRFQPLVARDAVLRLADNVITAQARLREPQSLREIVRSDLVHDLTTGVGSADLFADGIRFDGQLQPDTLTYLALGVIANAQGEVRGSGRIDWNEEAITSSGQATTDSLDFAAAFGPVDGLSGTVVFTDLLGLVTAPNQQLNIAAINPGIEVI